jgi:pimeloyl-ACP methyl ester carboxylesterase
MSPTRSQVVAAAGLAAAAAALVTRYRDRPVEVDGGTREVVGAWKQASKVFTWEQIHVDGNEVHYRVAGPVDAPAMIHQHGFAISGTYLLPTAALLTDSFRVYIPDLPGFGRSPKPRAPMTIEELASTLNHFMDIVGIPQATVVANSLGCAITSELINQAPEKVGKAVLVSLAGGPHNQPLAKALLQMAHDGLVEPPSLLAVAAPDYLRFGTGRALRLFTAMTRFPAYERIMTLETPTMVVIGSEDPIRPTWKAISLALAELPPQVEIVLFQGAAHAINFTHPEELAHAIRQFVAGEQIRMDADHVDGVPVLQLLRPV